MILSRIAKMLFGGGLHEEETSVLEQARTGGRLFGVELEFDATDSCNGTELWAMAEKRLKEVGLKTQVRAKDDTVDDYWKVVKDTTLYKEGIEIVSPPISDMDEFTVVCQVMRIMIEENRIVMSDRCGMHVHVDATEELSGPDRVGFLKALMMTWNELSGDIQEHLPPDRRDNDTCRFVQFDPHQLDELAGMRIDYKQALEFLESECGQQGKKYAAMNLLACGRLGTVEFRCPEATCDESEIAGWVGFCRNVVEHAARMARNYNGITSVNRSKQEEQALQSLAEAEVVRARRRRFFDSGIPFQAAGWLSDKRATWAARMLEEMTSKSCFFTVHEMMEMVNAKIEPDDPLGHAQPEKICLVAEWLQALGFPVAIKNFDLQGRSEPVMMAHCMIGDADYIHNRVEWEQQADEGENRSLGSEAEYADIVLQLLESISAQVLKPDGRNPDSTSVTSRALWHVLKTADSYLTVSEIVERAAAHGTTLDPDFFDNAVAELSLLGHPVAVSKNADSKDAPKIFALSNLEEKLPLVCNMAADLVDEAQVEMLKTLLKMDHRQRRREMERQALKGKGPKKRLNLPPKDFPREVQAYCTSDEMSGFFSQKIQQYGSKQ